MSYELSRQGKKTLSSEKKHRISIERNVLTDDGAGGFSEAWTVVDELWGAVSPIQAWQQYRNASVGVDTSHHIKVHGRAEILETDRLLFKDRVFEILTIEDIQEREILKLITCKERR
jgi:SPP1 family predicted phage head-tail adaptor